jgi:hypothetical protein
MEETAIRTRWTESKDENRKKICIFLTFGECKTVFCAAKIFGKSKKRRDDVINFVCIFTWILRKIQFRFSVRFAQNTKNLKCKSKMNFTSFFACVDQGSWMLCWVSFRRVELILHRYWWHQMAAGEIKWLMDSSNEINVAQTTKEIKKNTKLLLR